MSKKLNWIFVIVLAILLLLVKLPSYEMPLEPDSGANAFFARHMLEGETLYDTFHTAHHLPGIYYTFLIAFKLFGDEPLAPKLLLFPWTLICSLLLYFIGRTYFDEQAGMLSAIFFILVSSQRWVTGMTAEMEHFANLPLVAGIFLLLFYLQKQVSALQFLWIGLLGAIGILYKVTFVAPLVVAGVGIIMMAWITRGEAGSWKIMLFRLMWMAIGFTVPLTFVIFYFANLGLLNRLTMVFELGFNYFSDPYRMAGYGLTWPFGYPIYWMSLNNIALLLFGLIAIYHLTRRSIALRNINHLTDISLVLWLLTSLALAGMRGGGLPHYVLPVIPPLSLLAAVGINVIFRHLKSFSPRTANLVRSASIALVAIFFLWSNYAIYRDYIMYKFAIISYDNYLQNVLEDDFPSKKINQYIKVHTDSKDFIYLWSNNVETYYYTDRIPPIDILWPAYVAATGSPMRIFDSRTKYIILDTSEKMNRPQWLMQGISTDYYLDTVIEGREIYRRFQTSEKR